MWSLSSADMLGPLPLPVPFSLFWFDHSGIKASFIAIKAFRYRLFADSKRIRGDILLQRDQRLKRSLSFAASDIERKPQITGALEGKPVSEHNRVV